MNNWIIAGTIILILYSVLMVICFYVIPRNTVKYIQTATGNTGEKGENGYSIRGPTGASITGPAGSAGPAGTSYTGPTGASATPIQASLNAYSPSDSQTIPTGGAWTILSLPVVNLLEGGWTSTGVDSGDIFMCPTGGVYGLSYSVTVFLEHGDPTVGVGVVASMYADAVNLPGQSQILGPGGMSSGLYTGMAFAMAGSTQYRLSRGNFISLQMLNYSVGNYGWSVSNPVLSAFYVHP